MLLIHIVSVYGMIFYQDVDCTLTVNTDFKKKMRMITRKLIDREGGYCITKRNVSFHGVVVS